jgi:MHS family proline/betaine transporter-like MFS transporter
MLERVDGKVRSPLRDVFTYPRQLVAAAGIGALHASAFYTVMSYMVSYNAVTVGHGATLAFWASLVAGSIAMTICPPFGALSDRIGRKAVVATGAGLFLVLSVPLFMLIRDGGTIGAIGGMAAFGTILGILMSTTIVTMTELFPVNVRASAAAVGYNVSAAIFGGTAPFIAALLVDRTGTVIAPAFYLIFTATIGLIAVLTMPPAAPTVIETARAEGPLSVAQASAAGALLGAQREVFDHERA